MTKIVVSTDHAHIYGRSDPIPTGQVEFSKLKFLFSSEWDDLTKIVQFKQRESCYNVAMENDECFVPSELVVGKVQVNVRGYPKDSESSVIATANSVTLFVVQGFDSNGTPSVPPTPDLYQKLLSTIQSQIGDLDNLTTKAKENLVAAINEAAKTGSGGAGGIEMQVSGGYIQYSTDGGETWENLIAIADLKGKDGENGQPGTPGKDGTDGAPGQDGYSPSASVSETDTGATITITDKNGTTTATIKNGKDGKDGEAGTPGTPGTPGSNGQDGYSPEAKVEATADGAKITITDKTGTTEAEVKNGKDGTDGAPGKDGAGMDITGAAAGQIAKISAVDENGVPTAWTPADMPSGGGDGWEKVAETTLTEIVNEIRLNFDPCKAVYIEFQYGAVEDDLGVIGIYPNPKTTIYTAEKRTCAADITTSSSNKRGYIFCTIDRRKGTQWVAASQTFSRGDGTFGSINPGDSMNCDIWVNNNNTWASLLWKHQLVGTDYIDSVSAFGAGMNIGTTLTVWGIKA